MSSSTSASVETTPEPSQQYALSASPSISENVQTLVEQSDPVSTSSSPLGLLAGISNIVSQEESTTRQDRIDERKKPEHFQTLTEPKIWFTCNTIGCGKQYRYTAGLNTHCKVHGHRMPQQLKTSVNLEVAGDREDKASGVDILLAAASEIERME